jgi:PKD repeat protein
MRIGHVRLLLTACLATVGAVVSPLGIGVAIAQPTADFDWAPKPVVAGTIVTIISTSTPMKASRPITGTDWDLDGKPGFEIHSPAGSITASATAPAPGTWTVTVRVVDSAGESDTTSKAITVQAPAPPSPPDPPPPPPPPPPAPPNQSPNAAFAALPGSPLVGEEVTFVSYSDDRDGHITEQAWDMDGDGLFGDATGAVVTRRFSVPGSRTVTLRVMDDKGAASALSLPVLVREQAPAGATRPSPSPSQQPLTGPTPLPRMLSPFPIVRLVGSVTEVGTRIRLLAVRAPKAARALVRCRGRGCPVKRTETLVGRDPVRFPAFRRLLPAGVVLEVLVHRGDSIGKYTRFKLRRNRRPQRSDGCLWPGTIRMRPCPEA